MDSDEEVESAPEDESPDLGKKETGDDEANSDDKNGQSESKSDKEDASPEADNNEKAKDDTTQVIDEEEEYSDVIDEPVKPKRKQKEKKQGSKPAKATKAAEKKASIPEDSQEAEIKRLQSYLVKCGIRKLWHNELKKYDDDSRAKIRHLKKMLSDVGMDGRFSEAKAREIKDRRELMAEAEAAQEMNALWGSSRGGRSSRSKSKAAVEEVESEDGGEGEEEEEDEQETYAARRKRARADLAFLGDDSESD